MNARRPLANVILLGPNDPYPTDTDHLLLTEVHRDSGERVVEVSGAARVTQ